MITISFFINKTFMGKMKREVVPREGETIIIDCNAMVRVIDVSHQWDDPELVQINTVPFEPE